VLTSELRSAIQRVLTAGQPVGVYTCANATQVKPRIAQVNCIAGCCVAHCLCHWVCMASCTAIGLVDPVSYWFVDWQFSVES